MSGGTVIEVADGVSLRWIDGAWHLTIGPRRLRGGRYTLAVLEAFSAPTSVKDGVAELERRLPGVSAWVDLVAHVKTLHELGALVAVDGRTAVQAAHEKRFDSAPVHIRMLDDEARTASFQRAIKATVAPGDVVLDIGTGSGVLAVTAAKAGARHVYAVEATAMARAARRMAERNGVAERVTVVEGHSFDVDLPERADVLVSEIIGDDPLGERIVPTFADARERLLVADARIIPAALQVLALLVDVPGQHLEGLVFTAGRADTWRDRYDIDFTALVGAFEGQDHRVHVNTHVVKGWKRLADPVVVADVDLHRAQPLPVDRAVSVRAIDAGRVSGIVVFFTAALAPGVELSVHPDEAGPANSWGSVLHLLGTPLDVARGQALRMRYRFDGGASRLALAPADREET